MKRLVLSKSGTYLVSAILVISLSGCQKDVTLLDDSGQVAGKGIFEITAASPSPAHLVLNEKEYAGLWDVEKIFEASLAKSRRLLSDRAYQTYMTGNDPMQLKHGHASLTAGDGSKIQCDFYYRSRPDSGSCDVNGKQLKLKVE